MDWDQFTKGEEQEDSGLTKFDKKARQYLEHLLKQKQYPLYTGGRFYQYDGTRYVEEPELDQAVRTFFKTRGYGQSNNTIGNVTPIVKNYAHRPESQHGPLPYYAGKEPWPRAVIAYRNGLLDLDAWLDGAEVSLLPHTPTWLSTFCLPHDFVPGACCPRWLTFLDEVFEGDPARQALAQEFMGYCLTHDTSKQKALMLVGKRRAGKGTTQHVLQHLIGADNWQAFSLDSLVSDFGLSSLVNKTVAFVGEVELAGNKDRARILEKLKSVIGEDPQQVNVKHDPVIRSVRLPTRFVIACNSLPVFFDASQAITSRFLFLAFERSFVGREDEALKEKLLAEVEGINVWALEGLRRLKAAGKFTLPETHNSLLRDFSVTAAPIARFIEDCLLVHRSLDPGDLPEGCLTGEQVSMTKAACYEKYQEWCAANECEPRNDIFFGRDLRAVLTKLRPETKERIAGVLTPVYRGVGLKK
jgi:putative DNA primase/helicase